MRGSRGRTTGGAAQDRLACDVVHLFSLPCVVVVPAQKQRLAGGPIVSKPAAMQR
ncbi:hypothetical protein ACS15_0713 [Ralstonia insidiosa]|uniref:Uncharacterized protein n=1 Tax=Ralstonia insidiosa TaxID=190721 RepID=A0AAC9BH99_9RALS|nr:hypothetical protein ACS15_0713 [Ralstonia insidiosa]